MTARIIVRRSEGLTSGSFDIVDVDSPYEEHPVGWQKVGDDTHAPAGIVIAAVRASFAYAADYAVRSVHDSDVLPPEGLRTDFQKMILWMWRAYPWFASVRLTNLIWKIQQRTGLDRHEIREWIRASYADTPREDDLKAFEDLLESTDDILSQLDSTDSAAIYNAAP